jgi:ankyrin repeat protein
MAGTAWCLGGPCRKEDQSHPAAVRLPGRESRCAISLLLVSCVPVEKSHLFAHRAAIADIAILLLNHKANPNLQDQDGYAPLHWAVRSGNSELCQALLAKGADPTLATRQGHTALHMSATEGEDGELLSRLLQSLRSEDQRKAQLEARDHAGNTPLLAAG